MSDSPAHEGCDVSNADVTLFNHRGETRPSSEVGFEQAPIPTTTSTALVPPGTAQGSAMMMNPASSPILPGIPMSNFNTAGPVMTGVTAGTTYEVPVSHGVPTYPDLSFQSGVNASRNQDAYHPGVPIATTSSNMMTVHPTTPIVGYPPQIMMQMMEMIQKMSERLYAPSEPRISVKDIYVPSFDPDSHVGMNLIHSTNLSMVITSNGTRLMHQHTVHQVTAKSNIFEKLDCDLTDPEELNQLRT